MTRRCPVLLVPVLLLVTACGDRAAPTGQIPDASLNPYTTPDGTVIGRDAHGKSDAAVAVLDGAVRADGRSPAADFIVVTDLPVQKPSTIAQSLVDKLALPNNSKEFAIDLDGNGTADNQFGATVAGIKGFPVVGKMIDLQGDLNKSIQNGDFLLMFELTEATPKVAGNVELSCLMGKDTDKNPADNFSGTEELEIDPKSPSNLTLKGKVQSDTLTAGPGSLVMPIVIGGKQQVVTLKLGHVRATLALKNKQNMVSGQVNGAIPMTDVDQKLIGGIATMVNDMTNMTLKPLVMGILDKNKDGVVSVQEVQPYVSGWMKADVDTDGDKVPDAMSVGMGFTATACKIKKP